MEALGRLVQTDEWAAYQELLGRRFEEIAEGLLSCGDFAAYRYVVGALKAYEEMAVMTEQVLMKQEELRDRTRDSTAAAESDQRALRYGTRLWGHRVASS